MREREVLPFFAGQHLNTFLILGKKVLVTDILSWLSTQLRLFYT